MRAERGRVSMADRVLELRTVDQDAETGRKLGELRATESGRVTAQGETAGALLARVARVTGSTELEAFDLLAVNGWSNGHLTLVYPAMP